MCCGSHSRVGTVTGILVLKISVPWTEIFSGKSVPRTYFFEKNGPPLEKWSGYWRCIFLFVSASQAVLECPVALTSSS